MYLEEICVSIVAAKQPQKCERLAGATGTGRRRAWSLQRAQAPLRALAPSWPLTAAGRCRRSWRRRWCTRARTVLRHSGRQSSRPFIKGCGGAGLLGCVALPQPRLGARTWSETLPEPPFRMVLRST
eukprot:16438308-Heterocapsa_arctica.AAC.1